RQDGSYAAFGNASIQSGSKLVVLIRPDGTTDIVNCLLFDVRRAGGPAQRYFFPIRIRSAKPGEILDCRMTGASVAGIPALPLNVGGIYLDATAMPAKLPDAIAKEIANTELQNAPN